MHYMHVEMIYIDPPFMKEVWHMLINKSYNPRFNSIAVDVLSTFSMHDGVSVWPCLLLMYSAPTSHCAAAGTGADEGPRDSAGSFYCTHGGVSQLRRTGT